MAEKYLFTCTESGEGKTIHLNASTGKKLHAFLKMSHISVLIGLILLSVITWFSPLTSFSDSIKIVFIGFMLFIGFISLVSGILLVKDSHFSDGHGTFYNKTKTNWGFIRVVNVIQIVLVLLLNLLFLGNLCGKNIRLPTRSPNPYKDYV